MKVAVIGAGFAGLAVSWFLAKKGYQIDIFDPKKIGEGTSGIAAGLMHPFAGKRANLTAMGWEGMEATRKLLDVSSSALGESVIHSEGLLRPALTKEQEHDFFRCAETHKEVEWCEAKRCMELLPGVADAPGIYIPSAVTVNCSKYLEGLWLACQNLGAKHHKSKVDNLTGLGDYAMSFVCSGADTRSFSECLHLPITPIKGQILTITWPPNQPPMPMSLSSTKYLSMDINGRYCHAGATYERGFQDEGTEVTKAQELIMPAIQRCYPSLRNQEVINCRAGIRASTPNKRPLVQQIGNNIWVFAGLGSKGLLYHALFAEQLVNKFT